MNKKVIGFMASPRRQGNSEVLLDRTLEGAKDKGAEVEKIILCELNFSPCRECGGCEKTGLCVIKDDYQKIYSHIRNEELFIVASPLFFFGVSAVAKSMIDRCQCSWVAKYRLRKPVAPKSPGRRGILLSSRGMPGPDDFIHIKAEVKAFFSVNNIAYFDELLVEDCDGKGLVVGREDILEKAYTLGQRLISR
jgi:multimeric flavodoxin WrbA